MDMKTLNFFLAMAGLAAVGCQSDRSANNRPGALIVIRDRSGSVNGGPSSHSALIRQITHGRYLNPDAQIVLIDFDHSAKRYPTLKAQDSSEGIAQFFATPNSSQTGSNVVAALQEAQLWITARGGHGRSVIIILSDMIADPATQKGKKSRFLSPSQFRWQIEPGNSLDIILFGTDARRAAEIQRNWQKQPGVNVQIRDFHESVSPRDLGLTPQSLF